MTSQDIRVLPTDRSAEETRNLVANAMRAMGWTISTITLTQVVAKTPASIKSFGETVTATISNGQITIHSQAALGMTIADWGKNKENAQLLASNLSRFLGAAPVVEAASTAQFDPLNNQPEPFQATQTSVGCPYCASAFPPIATKQFSTEGWILALLAAVLFFPAVIVVLLLPQMYKTTNKCISCGKPYSIA